MRRKTPPFRAEISPAFGPVWGFPPVISEARGEGEREWRSLSEMCRLKAYAECRCGGMNWGRCDLGGTQNLLEEGPTRRLTGGRLEPIARPGKAVLSTTITGQAVHYVEGETCTS